MKLLRLLTLALAVTVTSAPVAQTPNTDAPAGGAAKDSNGSTGAPKTAPNDTGKSDSKPPAAK